MGSGYSIRNKGNSEAEVFIYEDVGASWFGGVSAKQFADDLKAVGPVDTIHVRINSYGGDVFDGVAIYRQLVENKAKVITHVDGVAASIASVIAMAGQEINIAEAGFMMIHDAWGGAVGPAEDMRRMADQLDQCTGAIADVYAARTKNAVPTLRDWMKDETWFTGKEAVAAGFADTLAENMKIAAHTDGSKHKFKHMPSMLIAERAGTTDILRPKLDTAKASIAAMGAKIAMRGAAARRA